MKFDRAIGESMTPAKLPLLHDHHTHPLLYAAFNSGVDLSDATSFEAAADLIISASKQPQAPEVLVAHHWKSNQFPIDQKQLESLPPVAIFNLSLHGVLMNDTARSTLIKRFGEEVSNISDPDWFERNLRHVLNWFATLGGSPDALVAFFAHLEQLGIGSAEEMLLVGEQEIEWFEEAGLSHRTKFWAAPETFNELSPSARSKVHGLKLFTDGAFGAWSAAISDCYLGQPENKGMLIYEDQQLQQILIDGAKIQNAIAIHAIGDVAIEQTITAIEQTEAHNKFGLIRVEHAQLISEAQAIRAKELGIVLSMQPNFNSDSEVYADRLPSAMLDANNPFRMLIDKVGFEPGDDLIFGSDGMPHGVEHGLKEVTSPPRENQKLTVEEFRRGYTDLSGTANLS